MVTSELRRVNDGGNEAAMRLSNSIFFNSCGDIEYVLFKCNPQMSKHRSNYCEKFSE